MSKTYVIGDIHGCSESLITLLGKFSPTEDDTIVFLGDYIDRGPDSKEVIDTVLKLKKDLPRVITLMGNHERMLLNFLGGRDTALYLKYGGTETLKSYGGKDATSILLPEDHARFINELLPYWEDDRHIYVHAGLQPNVPLYLQPEEWLLWARDNFLDSAHDFGKTVIFGHTVQKTPQLESSRIGIDTGAVYGGSLTCLVLPDKTLIQVKGKKFWPLEHSHEFQET